MVKVLGGTEGRNSLLHTTNLSLVVFGVAFIQSFNLSLAIVLGSPSSVESCGTNFSIVVKVLGGTLGFTTNRSPIVFEVALFQSINSSCGTVNVFLHPWSLVVGVFGVSFIQSINSNLLVVLMRSLISCLVIIAFGVTFFQSINSFFPRLGSCGDCVRSLSLPPST